MTNNTILSFKVKIEMQKSSNVRVRIFFPHVSDHEGPLNCV